MYNNRIEYLKRAIKKTYKRYIGEVTDKQGSLINILNFFNISIEESRLNDYKITKIDFDIPSIEIIDTKNGTLFKSEYTSYADLLNYSADKVSYIKVLLVNANRRIERLFIIGNKTPIIEKITFINGIYNLIFEREIINSEDLYSNGKIKFTIRYLQNLEHNGRNVKQQLLTKIFANKYKEKGIVNTFEQEYTYSFNNYVRANNSQDKYFYTNNGNVIYGINELEKDGICHYLSGICFEDSNVDVASYIPLGIDSREQIFSGKKSIIIFKGGTDNAIHHYLTIYKIDNLQQSKDESNQGIYLNYEAIKWENFTDENGIPQCRRVVVASKDSVYAKLQIGSITSSEIKYIINDLVSSFKDNKFIQLIVSELQNFANKMDIQKRIREEKIDLLSPKQFINKSFDEIYTLVGENIDEYFKIADDQFTNLTSNLILEEKQKIKILK